MSVIIKLMWSYKPLFQMAQISFENDLFLLLKNRRGNNSEVTFSVG